MKYTYILVDFFTILIPFVFSFHPKLRFDKHFGSFLKANIIVSILYLIWDIYFTSIGVWSFNPSYISGLYIYNLPVEEVLFFICIPFSCLFTFYCLGIFYKLEMKPKVEHSIILTISSILLVVGFIFIYRIYTAATFISMSLILLMLKYIIGIKWIGKLLIIYPVLLIPFFIVNGILTGSWINEPVVSYNNSEIIGIRLLTIPLEDTFYGFGLICLNVFLFELFKTKKLNPNS
jgi:lycopene cyclase domain-containing protein